MKSFTTIIILFFAIAVSAQTLTFTQYNVVNAQNLTLLRTAETINDKGDFRVHDVVDNLLNLTRTDIETWITSNFTNVNTNAFVLSSGNRIVTTAETTAIINGNTEAVKIDFNIVIIGGAFYFNLKGKTANLNILTAADMTDLENELNVIYASFVNTVQ